MPSRVVKKRKKSRLTRIILFLLFVFICADIGIIFYTKNKQELASLDPHTKLHKEKGCRVYYPDTPYGLTNAKNLCANKKHDGVSYNFNLEKKGDVVKVVYENKDPFYITDDYKDVEFSLTINDDSKMLVADFLRYSMKKDEIDLAYSLNFLYDTYYKNISLNDIGLNYINDDIRIYFPKYDYNLSIPAAYIQKYLNVDLGYEDIDYINRIHYVSDNRPMICFTFDDGPNLKESNPTSRMITERLDELDCSSTFFLIGYSIYNNSIEYCRQMSLRGMEFGSHTQNHSSLPKLSSEEIYREIMIPYWDLNNGFAYEMKYYRPPYGDYNDDVLSATKLTAILWNVDSLDWKLRLNEDKQEAVNNIVERVKARASANNIVLFHDIYPTTQQSVYELLDYYIDSGYQIVNVSELLSHMGISSTKLFFGG